MSHELWSIAAIFDLFPSFYWYLFLIYIWLMSYYLFECQYLYLLLRRLTTDRINSLTLTMVAIFSKVLISTHTFFRYSSICVPWVDLFFTYHNLLLLLSISLQVFLYSNLYRVEYWLTNDRVPIVFITIIVISFQRIDPYTLFKLNSNFYYISCLYLWLINHDYSEYELLSFVLIVIPFQRIAPHTF